MYMNRKLKAQEKLVCKKGKTSEEQDCALPLGPEDYPQLSFLFFIHVKLTVTHCMKRQLS